MNSPPFFANPTHKQDLLLPHRPFSCLGSDDSERVGEFQGEFILFCEKKTMFHSMYSPHIFSPFFQLQYQIPDPSGPTNPPSASLASITNGTTIHGMSSQSFAYEMCIFWIINSPIFLRSQLHYLTLSDPTAPSRLIPINKQQADDLEGEWKWLLHEVEHNNQHDRDGERVSTVFIFMY